MKEDGNISAPNGQSAASRAPSIREKTGRWMHSMMDGTFLTRSWFRRAIPFMLFLMLLGILYITNIFRVESTKRQIDDLEEELKELRYEYITARSRLMYESKPSEVVLKLKDTGIKETTEAPGKILVNSNPSQKP